MNRIFDAVILAIAATLLAATAGAQQAEQAATRPAQPTAAKAGQASIPTFEQFARRHDRDKDGDVTRDEYQGPALQRRDGSAQEGTARVHEAAWLGQKTARGRQGDPKRRVRQS